MKPKRLASWTKTECFDFLGYSSVVTVAFEIIVKYTRYTNICIKCNEIKYRGCRR